MSRPTDKFIKAASKMADMKSVEPSIEKTFPNIQNFGQIVEECGKAYLIMSEIQKDYEELYKKFDKLIKAVNKDHNTFAPIAKKYEKGLQEMGKCAKQGGFDKEYKELVAGYNECSQVVMDMQKFLNDYGNNNKLLFKI